MLFDLLLLFKILSVFQELASQLQSLESNETEFCELVFEKLNTMIFLYIGCRTRPFMTIETVFSFSCILR